MIKKLKIPRISPYRRGNVYNSVCIRGTDKFLLLSHQLSFTEEEYLYIASVVGRKDEAASRCEHYHLEKTSGKDLWLLRQPWTHGLDTGPIALIRAYLYENSIGSFGICTDTFQPIIAFRNKKDYFKYVLMFGNSSRLKTWDTQLQFWVFIDEKDTNPFQNPLAKEWNQSDPKGGWL